MESTSVYWRRSINSHPRNRVRGLEIKWNMGPVPGVYSNERISESMVTKVEERGAMEETGMDQREVKSKGI